MGSGFHVTITVPSEVKVEKRDFFREGKRHDTPVCVRVNTLCGPFLVPSALPPPSPSLPQAVGGSFSDGSPIDTTAPVGDTEAPKGDVRMESG